MPETTWYEANFRFFIDVGCCMSLPGRNVKNISGGKCLRTCLLGKRSNFYADFCVKVQGLIVEKFQGVNAWKTFKLDDFETFKKILKNNANFRFFIGVGYCKAVQGRNVKNISGGKSLKTWLLRWTFDFLYWPFGALQGRNVNNISGGKRLKNVENRRVGYKFSVFINVG